ncbi:MAG: PucR family transcriptional regulator [Candidatus Dormibacteria bacterium]
MNLQRDGSLFRDNHENWAAVEAPPGWEPVANICRSVASRLHALTENVVSNIQAEVPAYRVVRFPREDLADAVRADLELMLLGVAEHRGPHPSDLVAGAQLGHRRATQGVAVEDIVQAFQVTCRELWKAIASTVGDDERDGAPLLVSAATTVWTWAEQLTHAIMAAHREASGGRESLAVAIRKQFLDLVLYGDIAGNQAQELARAVGLKPEAAFTALVIRGVPDDEEMVSRLERALEASGPGIFSRHERRGLVLLVQGHDISAVEHVLRAHHPAVAMGVGHKRLTLAGARLSIGDAERALVLADDGSSVHYDSAWYAVTLMESQERLRAVLARGLEAAQRNPTIAQTIEAFVESGFSQSGTGSKLSVHANTVAYRLHKWEELTGWDPLTQSGLVCTLASLQLLALGARARRHDHSDSENGQGNPVAEGPGFASAATERRNPQGAH